MKACLGLMVASGLALPLAAAEGPVTDPAAEAELGHSLDWFRGTWAGTGQFRGQPTVVSLEVSPGIARDMTNLEFHMTIGGSDQQPGFQFRALATYRIMAGGRVKGQWYDSQGNLHALTGRLGPREMRIDWGSPDTEMGHSHYRLEEQGRLLVSDTVYSRGEAVSFATATYTSTE